eukprot:70254-Pleurochrysis_carterae.AAC.1
MEMLSLCEEHPQARYTINQEGAVEWVQAQTIDAYYIDSEEQLAKLCNLHQRGFETGASPLHAASIHVMRACAW